MSQTLITIIATAVGSLICAAIIWVATNRRKVQAAITSRWAVIVSGHRTRVASRLRARVVASAVSLNVILPLQSSGVDPVTTTFSDGSKRQDCRGPSAYRQAAMAEQLSYQQLQTSFWNQHPPIVVPQW